MLTSKEQDFLKISQTLEDRVKLLEKKLEKLEVRRNQDNILIARRVKEEVTGSNGLPPIVNFYT